MPTYRTVFISHAHTDNAICKQYADALRAKGIDVWIDLNNLQEGRDLGEVIARELRERTAFVLMVTLTSNSSHWVQQELGVYNILRNTSETRYVNGVERLILPVRLDGAVPTLFINLLWVEAENRPVKVMADKIAQALEIAPDGNGNLPLPHQSTLPVLPEQPTHAQPTLPETNLDVETLYMQARSAFASGDWNTAIAFFQQVVAREPGYDNGAARTDLDSALKTNLPVQADAAHMTGRWEDEIEYWNVLSVLDSENEYVRRRLAIARQNQLAEPTYRRAVRFVMVNDVVAARSEIDRLSQQAPYYGDPEQVGYNLGVVLPPNFVDYWREISTPIDREIAELTEKINRGITVRGCLGYILIPAMLLVFTIPSLIIEMIRGQQLTFWIEFIALGVALPVGTILWAFLLFAIVEWRRTRLKEHRKELNQLRDYILAK